jgi:hypothetical protein
MYMHSRAAEPIFNDVIIQDTSFVFVYLSSLLNRPDVVNRRWICACVS